MYKSGSLPCTVYFIKATDCAAHFPFIVNILCFNSHNQLENIIPPGTKVAIILVLFSIINRISRKSEQNSILCIISFHIFWSSACQLPMIECTIVSSIVLKRFSFFLSLLFDSKAISLISLSTLIVNNERATLLYRISISMVVH